MNDEGLHQATPCHTLPTENSLRCKISSLALKHSEKVNVSWFHAFILLSERYLPPTPFCGNIDKEDRKAFNSVYHPAV